MTLIAVTVVLIVLTVAVRWLYGLSPYGQLMKLFYSDIPTQVVPAELVEGVPTTFRTRIIQRHTYSLSLLVYFNNDEQRAAVDDLIGGPRRPGKLRTDVRIVVRDAENRIIRDQTVQAKGRFTGGDYLGRQLDRFGLDEGIYEISVTFLSSTSRLIPFRTALEVNYRVK
jgi:Domain of unknown function (DUF5625)